MLSKVMNSTAFILARSRLLYVEIRWGRVCLGYSLHPWLLRVTATKWWVKVSDVVLPGYSGEAKLICVYDGLPFCQRRVELRGLPGGNGAGLWLFRRSLKFWMFLGTTWYGMKTFWSCDFFSVEGANGFRIVQENVTSRRPAELTELVYFLLGTGSTDVSRIMPSGSPSLQVRKPDQRGRCFYHPFHEPLRCYRLMPCADLQLPPEADECELNLTDCQGNPCSTPSNNWVCLKMVSTPKNPMVLLIIIPTKWLFHWGYTPFSDIPNCGCTRCWCDGLVVIA